MAVTNTEAKTILSNRLVMMLREWGWSQGDLARAVLGRDDASARVIVSRWCTGKQLPTVAELFTIASVTGCPMEEFLKTVVKPKKIA